MAKLKNPVISLGAKGSLSNSISFTRRRHADIVEKKPVLPYFLTLPVQYQRWLYQDYAYLWTQQSTILQREYAAKGTRFHLTGFQYWMKYQLTNLPDIAAWYRFDEDCSFCALDSSKNENDAIMIGATNVEGVIAGGLYFDGINDRGGAPHHDALTFTDQISVEFFITPDLLGTNLVLLAKWRVPPNIVYFIFSKPATDLLYFYVGSTGANSAAISLAPLVTGRTYHVQGLYDGTDTRLFLDAVPQTDAITPIPPVANTTFLDIGSYNGNDRFWGGLLDNIIIRNRAPDQTEISRWAAREWRV